MNQSTAHSGSSTASLLGAAAPDSAFAGFRHTQPVLSAFIDVVGWDEALARIQTWATQRQSRYVCICNVHSVVTAEDDPGFLDVINRADMATPDGAPIAWSLREAGHTDQERINGPDLMWKQLQQAEEMGHVISFYGGAALTLEALKDSILEAFPAIRLGIMISPPFRTLTPEERQADVELINQAGTQILYVGLGCPKQEFWMAEHRGKIKAVMIGVGAAFDYHAGTVKRAPKWMQEKGLEWLHRLYSEPRRLWRRYFSTNSRFVWLKLLERVRNH